ncbi:MAG: dihydroflavonol-4-reductase [Granulosicoccus sp.]|jgi:dihydroflavonol-4-reductase
MHYLGRMVLVTGGTGLIGAHLIRQLLLHGSAVRAIKREGSNTAQVAKVLNYYSDSDGHLAEKVEWVVADVLDVPGLTKAIEGVSGVYHCAATVSFDPRKHDHMIKVNVEGTANIVNLCLENGNTPLAFVSSVAAIGRTGTDEPIHEETEWLQSAHNTAYAISKKGAEMEVWRGMAEGLKVAVVNPSLVVGPGVWGQSSTGIFQKVWEGLPFYAPGVNGFVDVRDVVNIMIKMMSDGPHGERFVLAAENRELGEVTTIIAKEFGKKPPFITIGPFLAAVAWRFEWVKSKFTGGEPVVTKETAGTAIHNNRYDNSKVKKALNYEFIPIDDSVKECCKHFLKDHS